MVLSLSLSPRLGLAAETSSQNEKMVFRYHLQTEPRSIDPALLNSTDANYFFGNLFRGLYSVDQRGRLVPELAKDCSWKSPLELVCKLDPKFQWSDGSPVTAQQFVQSWLRLLKPGAKSLGVELLKSVENAMPSFRGEVESKSVGMHAVSESELRLRFSEADPEFLYKSASPILAPLSSEKDLRSFSEDNFSSILSNGPYQIKDWKKGKRALLTSNLKYIKDQGPRPDVEILFLEDDEAALNLYLSGELSFLRRLPTHYIPKFKGGVDFYQVPVARFDYVGFGPALKDLPLVRKALSLALKYPELKDMFDALGMPGCPSLPARLYTGSPCVRYDLNEAKKAWKQAIKERPEVSKLKLQFLFSKQGGDDIKRMAEWAQAQWLKVLNLRVELRQMESATYISDLKLKTPAIFRKGIGLESPTCLSALRTFSRSSSDNLIRFANDSYQTNLDQMIKETSAERLRNLCQNGIKLLLEENAIIPQGEIHFTVLAKDTFSGWTLNELNQFDISHLRAKSANANGKSIEK
jgi:oligopeptide transport system substrate-binding protein